jgi:hypothetical protein
LIDFCAVASSPVTFPPTSLASALALGTIAALDTGPADADPPEATTVQ